MKQILSVFTLGSAALGCGPSAEEISLSNQLNKEILTIEKRIAETRATEPECDWLRTYSAKAAELKAAATSKDLARIRFTIDKCRQDESDALEVDVIITQRLGDKISASAAKEKLDKINADRRERWLKN